MRVGPVLGFAWSLVAGLAAPHRPVTGLSPFLAPWGEGANKGMGF